MRARSCSTAAATSGIVVGLYHRCGLGVSLGSPRSFWATTTERCELGLAPSRRVMNESYPAPFCTISRADAISLATDGLASNVCGSVLGLLMMESTVT